MRTGRFPKRRRPAGSFVLLPPHILWGNRLGGVDMRKKVLGVLAGVLCAAGVWAAGGPQAHLAAARAVAGKGMLELVQQSMEAAVKPLVALTFDDGPSGAWTPALLEGLKERDVHATFFLTGKNIEGNEELVRQMAKEGHLLGNHTYNHVELTKISGERAVEEIERTSNEIYEITGIYPTYVRPPFGEWPKNLDFGVTMFPVMWTIDTLDWKTKSVASSVQIVEKNIEDGSIILMHEGYETSVEAALLIVDRLKAQGYEFVTVDQLLVV